MTKELRFEVNRAKNVIRILNSKGLKKGDTFTIEKFAKHRGYGIFHEIEGNTLMSYVDLGILEKVGAELVTFKKTCDGKHKKVMVEDILNGNISGSFYTRNIYRVVYDDYREFIMNFVNELLEV